MAGGFKRVVVGAFDPARDRVRIRQNQTQLGVGVLLVLADRREKRRFGDFGGLEAAVI